MGEIIRWKKGWEGFYSVEFRLLLFLFIGGLLKEVSVNIVGFLCDVIGST